MSDMSISEWINKREMTGFPTFSHKDAEAAFPTLSPQVVSNELCRLGRKKRIQAVHKGFYTAVPLQFRERGIVPPYNYVSQLMAHLSKPYYVSLLSAGVLHGAAHQRPQRLSVTTIPPRISVSKGGNAQLSWCYRKSIPQDLLCQTNSDTDTILYSNAELTAIDLVQYSQLIGGLSVAATVIAELVEKADFSKNTESLVNATTFPTLQRLGYILDAVLDEQVAADSVEEMLKPYFSDLKYRPLRTDIKQEGAERNKRWKIITNQDIEPDIW